MSKKLFRKIKAFEKFLFRLLHYRRFLGKREGVSFALNSRKNEVFSVKVPGLKFEVFIRGNSSDVPVFEDTFIFGHYGFSIVDPPRAIVDAGAHIGLVSVLFANRFPEAKIISIEPQKDNFDLLLRNTEHYPNITAVNKALWSCQTKLTIANPDESTWSYRMKKSNEGQVDTTTIDQIFEGFQFERIDLLKIDVEGSEKEIFERSNSWIDRVSIIAAEVHDGFVPGCRRAFYRATEGFEFEREIGENIFVTRKDGMIIPEPN